MAIRINDREYAEPKRYVEGTHRSRSPSSTLADYQRFMPLLGITRLANVTGLDVIGLPVVLAIRPNGRGLSGAQGKGFDLPSAKASALMEAVEGWHAEHIEHPLRHDSYQSLRRSASVVNVTALALRAHKSVRPEAPLVWIEGYDLLQDRPTWVPYTCVSTNFVHEVSPHDAFVKNTNGLASGNHLLEAVTHGLCEVVERDSCTLATYATKEERQGQRVNLTSVDDPLCRRVLELVDRAGIDVAVRDVTSDIGIPTYDCTIFDRGDVPRWSRKGISGGHGCHLSPGIALLRALTEAIQSRLTLIAGSRDDLWLSQYESFADPAVLRVERERLAASQPARRFDRPSLATSTFEGDVGVLCAALRGAGIESVVVVDLTRPEIGVPVVKVVVPGLEGHSGGQFYSPGARARSRARGGEAS
jgi:ribosomal protein S12 methylthiotransferase accessory factor